MRTFNRTMKKKISRNREEKETSFFCVVLCMQKRPLDRIFFSSWNCNVTKTVKNWEYISILTTSLCETIKKYDVRTVYLRLFDAYIKSIVQKYHFHKNMNVAPCRYMNWCVRPVRFFHILYGTTTTTTTTTYWTSYMLGKPRNGELLQDLLCAFLLFDWKGVTEIHKVYNQVKVSKHSMADINFIVIWIFILDWNSRAW